MYEINISLNEQKLDLFFLSEHVASYSVSTALKGAGEKKNSEQTPRGRHYIRAKIGAGLPLYAVLKGRRFTGEIYSPALQTAFPHRDWILTRILWLSGLEKGKNRLGDCDTMQRYIYLHGTPEAEPMGVALSHGCIRMRNENIVELFDKVPVGTIVNIAK